MPKLRLLSNEVIILKEINVAHGGVMSVNNDDLILTNLNLIYIDKGILGNQKEILYFPLNTLKTYNGIPQIQIGHLSTGKSTLDFYYANGMEVFHFENPSDSSYKKWIEAVKDIFKKNDNNVNNNTYTDYKKSQFTQEIGTLKDDYKNMGKELIGAYAFKPLDSSYTNAASQKCVSCSAPLSGKKGELVKCKYCDTEQVL